MWTAGCPDEVFLSPPSQPADFLLLLIFTHKHVVIVDVAAAADVLIFVNGLFFNDYDVNDAVVL